MACGHEPVIIRIILWANRLNKWAIIIRQSTHHFTIHASPFPSTLLPHPLFCDHFCSFFVFVFLFKNIFVDFDDGLGDAPLLPALAFHAPDRTVN